MKNKKPILIIAVFFLSVLLLTINTSPAQTNKNIGSFKVNTVSSLRAGSTVAIEFEITIGEYGLKKGGRIECQWQKYRTHHNFKIKNVTFVSTTQKEKPVFDINENFPKYDSKNRIFAATLTGDTDISPGIKIRFKASLNCPKETNFTDAFLIYICPEAEHKLVKLDGLFELGPVKNDVAHKINCIAESRPLEKEKGRVTIAVIDKYNNPVNDFKGTIVISCNTDTNIPSEYKFTNEDKGSHNFYINFPEGEVSRLKIKWKDITTVSNPILPRKIGEPGIYFGDIHVHSTFSDGASEPASAYEYAQKISGLDFAALTDHSNYPTFNSDGWNRYIEIANEYNSDGKFATFIGYEWTHSTEGHRNIIYRGDEGPRPIELKNHYIEDVWADLDKKGTAALIVSNHPNLQAAKRPDGTIPWYQLDLAKINHHYQRLVEIQSFMGFEAPGPDNELKIELEDHGCSIQACLAKGHRLGFIGSSDDHLTRPGTHGTRNYIGRCAIISDKLTRRGLWDSLYNRSCYATTGKNTILFFSLNGQFMGSEVKTTFADMPRNIRWRVIGTAAIKRVDLLRNNIVIKSWDGNNSDDMSGNFSFSKPLKTTEWWYLRVIQKDENLAWSSPIWVDLI